MMTLFHSPYFIRISQHPSWQAGRATTKAQGHISKEKKLGLTARSSELVRGSFGGRKLPWVLIPKTTVAKLLSGYNSTKVSEHWKPLILIGNVVSSGCNLHGLAIQTFKNTDDFFFHYEVIVLIIKNVLRVDLWIFVIWKEGLQSILRGKMILSSMNECSHGRVMPRPRIMFLGKGRPVSFSESRSRWYCDSRAQWAHLTLQKGKRVPTG